MQKLKSLILVMGVVYALATQSYATENEEQQEQKLQQQDLQQQVPHEEDELQHQEPQQPTSKIGSIVKSSMDFLSAPIFKTESKYVPSQGTVMGGSCWHSLHMID